MATVSAWNHIPQRPSSSCWPGTHGRPPCPSWAGSLGRSGAGPAAAAWPEWHCRGRAAAGPRGLHLVGGTTARHSSHGLPASRVRAGRKGTDKIGDYARACCTISAVKLGRNSLSNSPWLLGRAREIAQAVTTHSYSPGAAQRALGIAQAVMSVEALQQPGALSCSTL